MEDLISAMTSKGHTRETAQAAITGRGYADLAREYLGTSGGGGGSTAPDISGVPSVTGFEEGLAVQETGALEDLISKMGQRELPLDIYKQFEEEAGLPQYRQTAKTLTGEIANIEDILEGVEPNVAASTRESLVTEAQRGKMVEKAREPHVDALIKLSTNLGRVGDLISLTSQGVMTQTELFLRGQDMGLEPYQLRYSALVDRNARRLSAFTADRQTQLDQIYKKWERENQLSDMEWELANSISSEERQYMRSLQTAAAEAGANITGDEDANALLMKIAAAARAEKNKGSATERAKAASLTRLREDVQRGTRGDDLLNIYGDELNVSEITAEYNKGPLAAQFGPLSSQDISTFRESGVSGLHEKGEAQAATEKSNPEYWKKLGYADADAELMAALY